MMMSGTEQRPLSPASIAHLRKVAAEISAFFEAGGSAPERPSIDAAWVVLEAAIDFGDGTTIEACRRVIDASLNGAAIDESDLVTVDNYFK
jgi:hypothetical protein